MLKIIFILHIIHRAKLEADLIIIIVKSSFGGHLLLKHLNHMSYLCLINNAVFHSYQIILLSSKICLNNGIKIRVIKQQCQQHNLLLLYIIYLRNQTYIQLILIHFIYFNGYGKSLAWNVNSLEYI